VERVHQADQQPLADPLGEEGHVHGPFVLGATAGARPVDDDLPRAQADRAPVQQAARHHPQEDPLVDREDAEEREGLLFT
jgi:hypothetical protein